jgi:hypothetical protein
MQMLDAVGMSHPTYRLTGVEARGRYPDSPVSNAEKAEKRKE